MPPEHTIIEDQIRDFLKNNLRLKVDRSWNTIYIHLYLKGEEDKPINIVAFSVVDAKDEYY